MMCRLECSAEESAAGPESLTFSCEDELRIFLIGEWIALRENALLVTSRVSIWRVLPTPIAVKDMALGVRPSWLLLGTGQPDERLYPLVSVIRELAREFHFAVLGPRDNLERCNRWLERGCSVYLSSDSSPPRTFAVLRVASQLSIQITDDCFQQLSIALRAQSRASLLGNISITPREEQVLRLIRSGLANGQIARNLKVSESTVAFHVGNILNKLSASNRTEAAQRATNLGIADP
jgi:DNA-binding NarL/FixJ family response regulator